MDTRNTKVTEDQMKEVDNILMNGTNWVNINELDNYATNIRTKPLGVRAEYIKELIEKNAQFKIADPKQTIKTIPERHIRIILYGKDSIRYGGRKTSKRNKRSKSNKRNKRNKTNKTHSVYTLGRFTR
jgi:hypothetical protein